MKLSDKCQYEGIDIYPFETGSYCLDNGLDVSHSYDGFDDDSECSAYYQVVS